MTQDEIIAMAREAGLWPAVTDVFSKELEHFATLVTVHEREACAKVCEQDHTRAMEWLGVSKPGGHFARAIRSRNQS